MWEVLAGKTGGSVGMEIDLRSGVRRPLVIRLPDYIKLTVVNDHEIRIKREAEDGTLLLIDTECLVVFDSRDEDKDKFIDLSVRTRR